MHAGTGMRAGTIKSVVIKVIKTLFLYLYQVIAAVLPLEDC